MFYFNIFFKYNLFLWCKAVFLYINRVLPSFIKVKTLLLTKAKITVKKYWNIFTIQKNHFLFEYIVKCNLFLRLNLYFQHHYSSLQCHMIFRNHYNILICCSINIYYYYQWWQQLCCFIFCDTFVLLGFVDVYKVKKNSINMIYKSSVTF